MSTAGYTVTLRHHRATWYYFTENPQGGGFGSNLCGSKRAALARALRGIPVGTAYRLIVNERDQGMQVCLAAEPGTLRVTVGRHVTWKPEVAS